MGEGTSMENNARQPLPYTRHCVGQGDIEAVTAALAGGDLATGRITAEYEEKFADYHGYGYGVAVSSGTAALWCALKVLDLAPGDTVITSPLTFAATANMILMAGGTPVFADVDAQSFNLTRHSVKSRITPETKAVVPVDFGGMLSNVRELRGGWHEKAGRPSAATRVVGDMPIVTDAAHSVGVRVSGARPVMRCYSTHAAKNMTTCEGGMVLVDDVGVARRLRRLRSHGIEGSYLGRRSHQYHMAEVGFNFRMPDPLAALGLHQLSSLGEWNCRRRVIRNTYNAAFRGMHGVMVRNYDAPTSDHLYVIGLNLDVIGRTRDHVFVELRQRGIGVQVHYKPVYWFRPYRKLGYARGLCPNAEWVYERVLTLPCYPAMMDEDVERVVEAVGETIRGCL